MKVSYIVMALIWSRKIVNSLFASLCFSPSPSLFLLFEGNCKWSHTFKNHNFFLILFLCFKLLVSKKKQLDNRNHKRSIFWRRELSEVHRHYFWRIDKKTRYWVILNTNWIENFILRNHGMSTPIGYTNTDTHTHTKQIKMSNSCSVEFSMNEINAFFSSTLHHNQFRHEPLAASEKKNINRRTGET